MNQHDTAPKGNAIQNAATEAVVAKATIFCLPQTLLHVQCPVADTIF